MKNFKRKLPDVSVTATTMTSMVSGNDEHVAINENDKNDRSLVNSQVDNVVVVDKRTKGFVIVALLVAIMFGCWHTPYIQWHARDDDDDADKDHTNTNSLAHFPSSNVTTTSSNPTITSPIQALNEGNDTNVISFSGEGMISTGTMGAKLKSHTRNQHNISQNIAVTGDAEKDETYIEHRNFVVPTVQEKRIKNRALQSSVMDFLYGNKRNIDNGKDNGNDNDNDNDNDKTPRIAGGTRVPNGQFNYFVFPAGPDACGGTLIHPGTSPCCCGSWITSCCCCCIVVGMSVVECSNVHFRIFGGIVGYDYFDCIVYLLVF